ncbi:MAG: zinc-ribbon domain-containing protein [Lachnospiraceae bacterium]|nr:zinc-ribbon domain-containing protein [Lachnospiraceae bacterium]
MFCRYCGKENKDGNRFCKYCGKEIIKKGGQQTDESPMPKQESRMEAVPPVERPVPPIQEQRMDPVPPVERPVPPMQEQRMDTITPVEKKAAPPVKKSRSGKPAGKKNTGMIIALIALALLVTAGAVFLVIYIRSDAKSPLDLFGQHKEEADAGEVEDREDEEEDKKEDDKEEEEEPEAPAPAAVEPAVEAEPAAEEEPPEVTDDDWQSEYRDILYACFSGRGEDDLPCYQYWLYDIDKDDIPELIVQFGTCEADFHALIYTYGRKERGRVKVGEIGMSHMFLYSYPSGNGLVSASGHMGYLSIDKMMLKDGEITDELLFDEDISNSPDAEYTDVSEIVPDCVPLYPGQPGYYGMVDNYRKHSPEAADTSLHTYEVFTQDVTWTMAYQNCLNMGGHLVRIDSEQENDMIIGLLNEKGIDGVVFIGGKRTEDEYFYRWVDDDGTQFDYTLSGGKFQKFWLKGEPSYSDTVDGDVRQEMYMSMLKPKGSDAWVWNDVCDDVLALSPKYYKGRISYICEW